MNRVEMSVVYDLWKDFFSLLVIALSGWEQQTFWKQRVAQSCRTPKQRGTDGFTNEFSKIRTLSLVDTMR